ncbi:MAG: hypothetical protein BWK80_33830 [Desulfobacteraceae bacterium IS3]|nr:MAG: hypothetical protein BWK80_33830 [Desulfobacteraceae bacterium IS3]
MECLCERCAKLGKTCCQEREIYITPGDVQRIAEKTGWNNFYDFCKASDLSYEDQDDDPMWAAYVFRQDGTRRVLKRKASGDCMFLGATGCVLALETRPLVCRLYPYSYNADGLYEELEEGCPVHLLTPGRTLEQELAGCSRENAYQWHHKLYAEIILEKPNHAYRSDLRPAV